MDCRWVVTVFLVGCFSDPPAAGDDASTGEVGTSSTGQPTSAVTTAAQGSSSSSSGEASSSSSSSSGAVDSSSTGPGAACPGTAACVMPPPAAWSGPVLARISDAGELAPQCPPESDEVWAAGFDPAAPCDCEACGSDITCDAELTAGANGFCDGATSSGTGCQPLESEVVGQLWVSFAISQAGGACLDPSPGAPLFRRGAVACAPRDADCEDGGTCVAGPACIWRDGEHECPAAFPQRTVSYAAVEAEALSCDTCECGAGSFFCEEATVTLHDEAACGGEPIATPALYGTTTCGAYEDPENFVLIEEVASVSIEPTPPDCGSAFDTVPASGTYARSGARTLCCAP